MIKPKRINVKRIIKSNHWEKVAIELHEAGTINGIYLPFCYADARNMRN